MTIEQVRAAALQAAVTLLAGQAVTPKDAINLAERFYQYIENGVTS